MQFTLRRTDALDRVYTHTNEGPEAIHGAANLAGYLQRPDIDAGYHVVTDNVEAVRVAPDTYIVWGAGGDNTHTLHVCIIGRAGQSAAEWLDAYSRGAIQLAAKQVAAWCKAYNIPATRVAPGSPGRAPTERGIAGHVDDHHPNSEGHTDPGVNFPWDYFLQCVRQELLALGVGIDWVALKAINDWYIAVSKSPLHWNKRSPHVEMLKALLKNKGYRTYGGPLYGMLVRLAVHSYKKKNGWANPDGKVVGAAFAKHILGL